MRNFSWERISILTQREKPFLQVGYNYVQEQVNNAKHVVSLCFAKVEGMIIQEFTATNSNVSVESLYRFYTDQDIDVLFVSTHGILSDF